MLLLPARSAEPPHNSGSFGPSADSTAPEAARVASALDPGSQWGKSASQPSGNFCASSRSSSALRSGSRRAQASNSSCQRSWACLPRATSPRVWVRTSSRTWNVLSGSKPTIFLTAATSSSPSAAPCALPVSIRFGAG
ncbi:Uncharacterised protein [Mycobacterium tuberculosis]|uniref:Uncharacterized protein n=1 Tax=Mycobacterium tuberculosis TaxID=1773 RepID=A0A654U583_MYCTX|nr:Uncharacterised protein [Mycobacterium tuberculosis]